MLYYLILFILILGYVFFTGEIRMIIPLLSFYLIGRFFIRLILRSKDRIVITLYKLFFIIYGLLVLLTHIELIHDPMMDFYIHNDAAWSFYSAIMNYVVPESWDNLEEVTYKSSLFADYPIASYIFGFLAKLGIDLGLLDIRLYLRIHVFTLAALIIAIMSHILLVYKQCSKNILKWMLLFGFGSYLYVTSGIFSRDIHVFFMYTLLGYYFLLPKFKYKLVIFITLVLITTGLRPVNGFILIIPILLYYWVTTSMKNKAFNVLIPLFILMIIVLVLKTELLSYGLEKLDIYKEKTLSNTGGIFERVFSLPFPINQIGMIVYMSLMPLPIFTFITNDGGTFLTLPFIVSPYIMSIVLVYVGWYIIKSFRTNRFVTTYLIAFLLLYVIIIFGSPDLRRAFAAVPGLFVGFCLIKNSIPLRVKRFTYRIVWPLVLFVNLFFVFYLYF